MALVRQDGTTFTHKARILPPTAANAGINRKYVERLVKFLLWQKGGCKIQVAGCPPVARMLAAIYAEKGLRAFDRDLVGRRMFGQPIAVEAVKKLPPVRETQQPLGRHLDGCRIGFDLGGSDRKCAAVVDGNWEVSWDRTPFACASLRKAYRSRFSPRKRQPSASTRNRITRS